MTEQRNKLLHEIKEQLRTAHPCKIGQEERYFAWLGKKLLNKQEKLSAYFQQAPQTIMLNDLKERLEKIKSNELPDYNQALAYSICQELTVQQSQSGLEVWK